MSVVIETTLGDITVDLFVAERPTACMNFLKLCKLKYYNYNLFHTISRGFIAQTGDPTGSRTGGESVFGILNGSSKRYFQGESKPRIKHTKMGLISFVGDDNFMLGSQFFITLGDDLIYLDEKHCVFGEVVEGFDILEIVNEVICDGDDRPYQDVRITHTVVLDDPFPDPEKLRPPSRSPSPSAERLMGGRIAPDEDIDEMEGKNAAEVAELQADREAKARATILEMVGDIPDAEMAPPENVLFVCKLNPVTTDEDLEIIFNRFGKIKSCEVIRDRKTGDSLQYAFIEFEDRKSCEDAYFKMDNILIDDRRIHVDFSQSVSKIKWHGKGRGVSHYDENGKKLENGSGNRFDHKFNNYSKKQHSDRPRESEKHSHNTSRHKIENRDTKNHYDKKDKYSSNRAESRDSSRRFYEKDNRASRREDTRYDRKRTNQFYEDYDFKRKLKKSTAIDRNKRHYSEEKSRNKEKSRRYIRSRYSSESSDSFEKEKGKHAADYKNQKLRSHYDKHKSKSIRSSSSKKKMTSSDTSSSSESSDSEHSRKMKKYRHSKKKQSTESSSEDGANYKKKRNTAGSDSEKEFRNKKYNKRKTKKRKSSDNDSDRKRIKR